MRIDLLTIFPQFFDSFLGESLLAKAIEKNILAVNVHDIRAHAENKHHKVDDAPFGGGAGMVMAVQPIADAIESLKKESPARTILLSPRGKLFTQEKARELAKEERLILICGRYEGVDERIVQHWVDEELSLGDYILNGGEVAAMAVMEAVFRLLPGAVGCDESLEHESFEQGLLEYPQYTRPEEFRGLCVPEELISGHHENIKKWRHQESVRKTRANRPDLLAKKAEQMPKPKFSVALVHYPVSAKNGSEMISSITTLDVHDIARLGKTYGAQRAYIVTPVVDQQLLAKRMVEHWLEEDTLKRLDNRRSAAVEILNIAGSIDEMLADARKRCKKVKLLATTAAQTPSSLSPADWRMMAVDGEEWIIMFGTAYGLGKSLLERADGILAPIDGDGEFNHLPVRGASAIILDRLLGRLRS